MLNNPAVFRARVKMITRDKGLNLDASENKYSVWSYDGIKAYFIDAESELSLAVERGRRISSPAAIYILVGSEGEILPLDGNHKHLAVPAVALVLDTGVSLLPPRAV